MSLTKAEIVERFRSIQDEICKAIEATDGLAKFKEDRWERPGGGGGHSRVMQEGNIIEKGGVNFSAVEGELPSNIAAALKVDAAKFFATGVSIVMHPYNPYVPIIHMNVRYFEMDTGDWWFGGGIDLTPHYINAEEADWFHATLKSCCDRHHPAYHSEFSRWADRYFYIKHRKESRGVSGIFFDRLNANTRSLTKAQIFDFVVDVANQFAPIYTHLMSKHANSPFQARHKEWQRLRRSRYVEFNLVYDKGTKFGLDTDGRVESILMSLPPETGWKYNVQPEHGSEEYETLEYLRTHHQP